MAVYYKKLIELQEKLNDRERVHCKRLQLQCRKLIDKDRRRCERNESILRSLEEIESRMCRLTTESKIFKTIDYSKQLYSQEVLQGNRAEGQGNIPTKKKYSFLVQNEFEDNNMVTNNSDESFRYSKKDIKHDKNTPLYDKGSEKLNLAEFMTNSISSRFYGKNIPESELFPNYSRDSKKDYLQEMNDESESQNMKRKATACINSTELQVASSEDKNPRIPFHEEEDIFADNLKDTNIPSTGIFDLPVVDINVNKQMNSECAGLKNLSHEGDLTVTENQPIRKELLIPHDQNIPLMEKQNHEFQEKNDKSIANKERVDDLRETENYLEVQ
ncbi:hypothetical protein JTB14_007614 [Gonioctena quinquepunctata]|nr:hypothetical protein JTB14_007614 [Gonioctena quinquepunctata]